MFVYIVIFFSFYTCITATKVETIPVEIWHLSVDPNNFVHFCQSAQFLCDNENYTYVLYLLTFLSLYFFSIFK